MTESLETLLQELQKNRPQRATDWLTEAKALVEQAKAPQHKGSAAQVCVAHELINAHYFTDPSAARDEMLALCESHLAKPDLLPQCAGCMVLSKADYQLSAGDMDGALETIEAALDSFRPLADDEYWAKLKLGHGLWQKMLFLTLAGRTQDALGGLEAHHAHHRECIAHFKKRLDVSPKSKPAWIAWFRSSIQNSEEYILEADILGQAVRGEFAKARRGIVTYLEEVGDGGTGMASVMHATIQRAADAGAWRDVLALAEVIEGEFERRGLARWWSALLVGVVKAHTAVGDTRSARVALMRLDDMRGALVEDDMEETVVGLEDAIRAKALS